MVASRRESLPPGVQVKLRFLKCLQRDLPSKFGKYTVLWVQKVKEMMMTRTFLSLKNTLLVDALIHGKLFEIAKSAALRTLRFEIPNSEDPIVAQFDRVLSKPTTASTEHRSLIRPKRVRKILQRYIRALMLPVYRRTDPMASHRVRIRNDDLEKVIHVLSTTLHSSLRQLARCAKMENRRAISHRDFVWFAPKCSFQSA